MPATKTKSESKTMNDKIIKSSTENVSSKNKKVSSRDKAKTNDKAKNNEQPKELKESLQRTVELAEEEEEEYIDEDELPELAPQEFIDRTEYKPIIEQKIIYVQPNQRICSEVMTKFEYAMVLSTRAKQLEDTDTAYTDVRDITDPIKKAQKEIADKMCPLSIIRVRTTDNHNIIAEKWHVNEMAIPSETLSW